MEWIRFLFFGIILATGVWQGIKLYKIYEANKGIVFGTQKNCFDVSFVTDNDHDSRDSSKFLWKSIMDTARIKYLEDKNWYEIELKEKERTYYTTMISKKNRSMELSALQKFNNKVYGFCDYTGIMYELPDALKKFEDRKMNKKNEIEAIPTLILQSGNGRIPLPFKSEWVTLKDGKIYVGSIGKEWAVNGKILHYHCEWVKVISLREDEENHQIVSKIEHQNWSKVYSTLRKELGYELPGYFLHEAVIWDNDLRNWIFIPRKASKTMYNERDDQYMGSNIMIFMDENFNVVRSVNIGENELPFGFSAFAKLRMVKNEDSIVHHYVGVKAMELSDAPENLLLREMTGNEDFEFKKGAKIVVFDSNGKILSNYVDLGEQKFEGLEVLHSYDSCQD